MAIFTNEIRTILTAKDGGAASTLGKFEKQTEATADAWDKLASRVGISGETLKKGLSSLGTAALGAGLVSTLKGAADAYVEAATGANMLAQATNASVEDASRFNAVAQNMGLGMNDLVEIFSDFQQAAAASSSELAGMGVEMKKTSTGQTDWIATATSFLTKVQSISDATERNRLLFKFFGEEGAKQLMGLVNSGQSVAEALKAISDQKIISDADVRAAQEYTRNMDQLQAAVGGLGEELGRTVVPAVSGFTKLLTPLVSNLAKVPDEMYLAAAAALAFQKAMGTTAVAAGFSAVASSLTALPALFGGMATTMNTAGKAAKTLATGMKGLAVTSAPLVVLTAFVGLSMDLAAAGDRIRGFVTDLDQASKSLEEQAKALGETEGFWEKLFASVEGGAAKQRRHMAEITKGLQDNARATLASADATDAQRQAAQDLLNVIGEGDDKQRALNLSTDAGAKAQEAYAEALDATAANAKKAEDANKALNDLIAGGAYTQQQYADAVVAAANAQETNATNTRAAKDAVDGYLASTKNAFETTLSLIDSIDARKDAWDAYQESLKGVSQAEKDAGEAASSRADAARSQADAVKRARDAVGEARKADDKKSTEASRAALRRAQEGLADAQADQAKGQRERSADAVEAQEKQTKAVKDTNEAVVDSAKRYAEAAVKAAEGQARMEGGTLDVRDAHDLYIESLKKAKKESDTTTQRTEIQKLITKLEEAQKTAGEGIKIGEIRFKEGTTKKQIDQMNKSLKAAMKSGNFDAANSLRAQLKDLEATGPGGIPNIAVPLVGPDGKPITEPITATITPTVSPESATKTNEDLLKLTGDREAKINATVHNQQNTINVLDGLAGDREMTITVHYKLAEGETVPPGVSDSRRATSSAATLLAGPSVGALTATQPIPSAAGGPSAGATFNATVVNNYPAPERASDSVAASLRVARYAVGL